MTTTFNLNKSAIITRALQMINAISLDATASYEEIAFASDILNLMIKKWEAQGVNIWKRRLGYLFPDYNTASYSLGSAGDNAALSYIQTTVSSGTGTSLTVDDDTDISSGDYIGIELDDGTRQWTTVNGAPAANVITLTDALTDTVSDGNTVITYTTKITRPLKILRATIKDLSNNSETKMGGLSYDEYFDMPLKSTLGRSNNYYYDKLLVGSTPYTGTLYLYPTPNSVNQIMVFSYQESLSDMTNSTDYAEFPQEWIYALIINLACELAFPYGKTQELQLLLPKAQAELDIAQLHDSDDTPLHISFRP
jgi:hypothetical protein